MVKLIKYITKTIVDEMDDIKHLLVSRMSFDDKELMKKYLIITKDILIPSLKSQINKKFTWGLFIKEEDIEYIKEELDYDFISFKNRGDFGKYIKENNINIQTRHDIDDWMSPDYIDIIQKKYIENIEKLGSILIQSQPIKIDYKTKKETKLPKYTNNRNSMHLTLCQKNVKHTILDKIHIHMWKVCKNVISLPEGYTKWVIHGDNISVKKGMIK